MNEKVEAGLLDAEGRRKYLNEEERGRFLKSLDQLSEPKRLFCLMLFWSGARISEILNIQAFHLNIYEHSVTIATLKQRRKRHRTVPLPSQFVQELNLYIESENIAHDPIWTFSRRTASRCVKTVMINANILGIQSSAKGLRHSFGVHAVLCGIPLTLIKKWMGHQSLKTTEIYLQVMTKEERIIAQKMWC